jgi:hypothetical protein
MFLPDLEFPPLLIYKAHKIFLGAYSALFFGGSLSVINILFNYSACLPLILEHIYEKTSCK